jgi:hypothetical protein
MDAGAAMQPADQFGRKAFFEAGSAVLLSVCHARSVGRPRPAAEGVRQSALPIRPASATITQATPEGFMKTIGCHLVVTIDLGDGLTLAAAWDGGPQIGLHLDRDGVTAPAGSWPIWNPAWDSPLIQPTRESFERFVAGRLAEPGVADELVALAAA